MPERELVQTHEQRYQRRNDEGTFSDSDDGSRSLSADVRQHAEAEKPKNEGDRWD